MTATFAVGLFIIGAIVGAVCTVLALRPLVADRQSRLEKSEADKTDIQTRLAISEQKRVAAETRCSDLQRQYTAEQTSALQRMATETLNQVSKQFLTLAEQRLEREREAANGPMTVLKQQIESLAGALTALDRNRTESQTEIRTTLEALQQIVDRTNVETRKLSSALSDPTIRGQWGEVTLKRIVELAGMTEHCDFDTQITAQYGSDRRGRPDMLVNLPGGITLPVDAKVPLSAYQAACATQESDAQRTLLLESAQALRSHINALAARKYDQSAGSAGFCIMFVGVESMLSATLSVDPAIITDAADKHIHIASPLTLLTYLRAFAKGWMMQKHQENAARIVDDAKQLFERLVKFIEHLNDVSTSMNTLVTRWNAAVGSFENRVMVTTRRMATMTGHQSSALPSARAVEVVVREAVPPSEAVELPLLET